MKKTKFNFKIKSFRLFCFVFLFSIFYFLFSAPVFAAELFLQTSNQKLAQGDEFLVNVVLSTAGESINAVQAKIIFPDALLRLKEIRDANSIVNFWVVQPKAFQAGVVNFSGVVPSGYKGTSGLLFSMVFSAKSVGNGEINFDNTADVLLNDGKGTQANLKISPLKISVLTGGPTVQSVVASVKDTQPPEDFAPEVSQSPEMFDGKYFLVFSAQDNGSGIDHYEVLENRKQKIENRMWIIASSPYVLQDQKLRSFIYVKAVDGAGNEKIETVQPRYPVKWYEIWWLWCIMILGVVVLCVIGTILWKRKS